MKIKISYLVTLLTGIGIGAVAMYKYMTKDEEPAKIFDLKKDEEERAAKDAKFQEDLERVKSEVMDRFEQSKPKKKEGGKRLMKGDIAEVYDTGEFAEHDIPDDDYDADIPVIKNGDLEPHVIDMDDYGLFADYQTMSVVIYADGYVADDMEHLVENPEVLLGKGVIDFFKTHDIDCVYIRNDNLATDIEVIRDLTDWADFVETLPPDYYRMKWED